MDTTCRAFALEHRKYERAKVYIVVPWSRGPECLYADRVTNFSAGGCFLQTEHWAPPGAEVFVRLWVSEERALRCAVRYRMEGVGMGVEFRDLSDGERLVLGGLVGDYRRSSAQ